MVKYKFRCSKCKHQWHEDDYANDVPGTAEQQAKEIDYHNGMACPQCGAGEDDIRGTQIT